MFRSIGDKFNTLYRTAGHALKKHSPEILVGLGVVGMVAGTVMACKATTKIEPVVKKHKKKIAKIEKKVETEEITEEEAKKEIVSTYAETTVETVKIYGPAIFVEAVSIVAILGGHNILRKRSLALAALYSEANKKIKEYEEKHPELLTENFSKEVIKEKAIDEDGNEVEVEKEVLTAKNLTVKGSIYSKYLTRINPNWEDDPDYMNMFLRAQESYACDLLRTKKFLTLNEVYRMLDLKETKGGMVCGWIYDQNHPVGDNKVIFDIKEVYGIAEDGINREKCYLIDFNVDGNIYEKVL